VDSTWETRELVVLEAAVRHFDNPEAKRFDLPHMAEVTGLDGDTLRRALRALYEASPPYIDGAKMAEQTYPEPLTGVTERARRAVGAWPTADNLADA